MRKEIPMQLVVALAILLLGGVVIGAEYFLAKLYPRYRQHLSEEALKLLPYRNDALGVEMQVAAGIYDKIEDFPGGVKILRPSFWTVGPSLTITSQPNPDRTFEFTPQILAKWQTQGTYEEIFRYGFDHMKIGNRDAVLIRQWKGRAMLLTARIISSERIIQADCTPGRADEALYLQACEASLLSIKVSGPEPPPPPAPGILELTHRGPITSSPR